ncbi:MAG: response regulator [Proteobacteria bacterium]|nr:response regulator [Pseudomonadota bacterium]
MKKTLLVVDDEKGIRESLRWTFKDSYAVALAKDGREALKAFEDKQPDLILLDIVLPDINGLEILRQVREKAKRLPVIMITATRTVKNAVEAMKLGADDYIVKPFDPEELRIIVRKALNNQDLAREVELLRSEVNRTYGFDNIIGKSKDMREIFKVVRQVADSKTTILVTGESGTGKELISRAIHYHSSRKNNPFVTINCAAIPETLIESELFGHERGAFTSAYERKIGRFEMAHTGSLFLDEIGELSLSTQSKILRFLEERELTRVGGSKNIKVDVRLIAATNKRLEESIVSGTFREDLYYRINVVPIDVPPLRNRKEDIPLLAHNFMRKLYEENQRGPHKISKEAIDLLVNYDWPGNVRELENLVERVMALSTAETLTPEDLPNNVRENVRINQLKGAVLWGEISLTRAVEEFERDIITDGMRRANYVQSQAAVKLGISRRILKYKLDKLKIDLGQDSDQFDV